MQKYGFWPNWSMKIFFTVETRKPHTNCEDFFLKGALICFFNPEWYLADIRPEKINSANFVDAWSKIFFSKIDFFRFFKKWSRMDVNIKYWLEMCFEHFGGLFWTISEHLWWPDSPLKKFDFLKKMNFLRFFGIFDFGRFGYKKASKMSNF